MLPISAAPGMGKSQAQTMFRVTFQRTAVRRLAAPTPELKTTNDFPLIKNNSRE
jgi:hypothetical protein